MSTSSKEVIFAIHVPATEKRDDAHFIKERIYNEDGTYSNRSYIVKNLKRPIWVTKPNFRNHKDKKEFEDVEKLVKLETTESDKDKAVLKVLNIRNPKESPYVYGYDITSTSMIKLKSLIARDGVIGTYSVAAFDIETDIQTKEIILASIVFQDHIYCYALKRFVKGYMDMENYLAKAYKKLMGSYAEKYKYSFFICDKELDLIRDVFKKANELAPDFLAIWNMDYDIPHILSRLEYHKARYEDYICLQDIPRNYRVCRYKQGIKKKVKASGKVQPISPSLQWHSLICTANFYVIDAMCAYRQLRMGEQEKPSYSLDYITHLELGVSKIKLDEFDNLAGVAWHEQFQKKYPLEYAVYNMFDCVLILELDKKTGDLSSKLPSFAGFTDFTKFNSNPKKIVDALFYFAYKRNRIIGTAGKVNEEEDYDDYDEDDETALVETSSEDETANYRTLNNRGWIVTLPQNLLVKEGLRCIEEDRSLVTNIRGFVFDSDVTSAYPNATLVANVSKETTRRELSAVDGIPINTVREQNLGFIYGKVNSLEYAHVMLGLPKLSELDELT